MDIETVKGTIPVRPGEDFDREAVLRYLQSQGLVHGDEPLKVVQFPTGASNLTYLIQSGDFVAVLRRPPFGPLPPKAHDMKRESALLSRLYPVFHKVPRPYAFCEDESVIGGPFYVMEYRPGVTLDTRFPDDIEPTPALCRAISETVIDTLAELHQVDYRAAGLAEFGKPEGFLERQVRGWIDRYHRSKTDDIPGADRLMAWLADHIPASPEATVIHNDYKLNNMLLDPSDLTRVVAIVDWEMATIGDPLFDLAVTLSYWIEPDDPPMFRQMMPTVTQLPGFYTREAFIHRYALRTGRTVDHFGYYQVFADFKLAVILQQIYFRWKRGQTQDPRFAGFGDRVKALMEHAVERMERQGG
ncbi:MAG: phosphotransferase family protein [Thermoflavifilum sp.]|nr:phosphotransferase family protein [Thermoflavifilum sp.]MCL6514410.1 phosphotransferase family protein [Alicyclobacillus sp.]